MVLLHNIFLGCLFNRQNYGKTTIIKSSKERVSPFLLLPILSKHYAPCLIFQRGNSRTNIAHTVDVSRHFEEFSRLPVKEK